MNIFKPNKENNITNFVSIDEVNHAMELIRTVVPVIILVIHLIILTKI